MEKTFFNLTLGEWLIAILLGVMFSALLSCSKDSEPQPKEPTSQGGCPPPPQPIPIPRKP